MHDLRPSINIFIAMELLIQVRDERNSFSALAVHSYYRLHCVQSGFSERYLWKFYQWYHSRQPVVPLETMVSLVETLVPIISLVGTIGKPNGVNSIIMINASNLVLFSYILGVYSCISVIC